MKKKFTLLMTVSVLFFAFAANAQYRGNDVRDNDLKGYRSDIRHDKGEIFNLKQNIRNEKFEIADDLRFHDHLAYRRDKRELKRERRELRCEKRDLRRDRREFHERW